MNEYTIDELARVAETTVRSVRVYHERGLLPSPDIRGRIGYYGVDHVSRLQTISRLLSRGMKLNGIRELLEAWDRGDGLADILGVPDQSDETTQNPPTAQWPELPEYLHTALANSDDPLEGYRITNPRCCDLVMRLIDTGLSLSAAFEMIERLRSDCERIADRYGAELFYQLAGRSYEQSAGTSRDRTAFETNTAVARLIGTRAVAELIDQALARDSENPQPPTA
ncbi:MerR family transcriptional regulator [Nocardia tengchongensis]|uniref:MerR family transcriptional regulator n=1 Tax=Nocardia tengchongensis TaxID=2055889 RepID=UPI0036CF3782